jgi:hypothetical protein
LQNNFILIEKIWTTLSGFSAAVVLNNKLQHRCGYVGVDKENPLYEIDYNELENYIFVHGGLTYSGPLMAEIKYEGHLDLKDLWYFGYDCGHSMDKNIINPNGIERTLDYCVDECENLANQLKSSILSAYYKAKKNWPITEEEHNKMLALAISNEKNSIVKEYFEKINK